MMVIRGTFVGMLCTIGCATGGQARTQMDAAPEPKPPSARIIDHGTARRATVPEAVHFLKDVLTAQSATTPVRWEQRVEQADGAGNHRLSLVRQFDDGSTERREETVDATGQLVRLRVYDDDAEGLRSGIRI